MVTPMMPSERAQRKQQATYDEDDEEQEEEEKDMEAELEAEFASDSESDSEDIKARSKGLQENAKRVADLFMGPSPPVHIF